MRDMAASSFVAIGGYVLTANSSEFILVDVIKPK